MITRTSWKNSQNDGKNNTNDDYTVATSHSLKSKLNEYNTLGMQWANSSSTKIGDCKVLYKPSVKKYVLVEATKDDIGFIELNVGTYEQMNGELEYYDEQTKRIISKTETVDKVLRDSEIGQNNYNGNNVNVGYGGKGIPNAQIFEDESNSNRTGNSSKTEKIVTANQK